MELSLSAHRQMNISFALQQSLEILQMPQQELLLWLHAEVEKNPLLEASEPSYAIEGKELPHTPSLYEHLKNQIFEANLPPEDQKIAGVIIGSLDEKGFLTTPLEEIGTFFQYSLEKITAVLHIVQSFDPPGIAARTLQESFLIQLKKNQTTQTAAYRIVNEHFEDLLHGRYTNLKKTLRIDQKDLTEAIQQLARLALRPASAFQPTLAVAVFPDLKAWLVDQTWHVEISSDEFPEIQIRKDLPELLPKLAAADKKTVKQWLTSAKWLLRSLNRRRKLLLALSEYLVHKQSAYLEQKGPFLSITISDLAQEFQVHESTIHRALSGKWIQGPWGLISLKSLLSHTAKTNHNKYTLQKLIEQENRQQPLTDQEISALLQKRGISLARRTISKYRKELRLESAAHRKFSQ